jgi:hypothetical protein
MNGAQRMAGRVREQSIKAPQGVGKSRWRTDFDLDSELTNILHGQLATPGSVAYRGCTLGGADLK